MRNAALAIALGTLIATVGVSEAEAACRPVSADALLGDLSIRAQVLVAPQAAQPYAVVRCHLSGVVPDRVWIPLVRGDVQPQVITVDAWDRLWNATAPRSIVREPPSAAVGEVPQHDLDPPVAALLGHPEGPTLEADVRRVEPDLSVSLPERAEGLVDVRFAVAVPEGGGWTPWIRLPLAETEDGRTVLPVLPESSLVGETGTAQVETTLLFLGADAYWAVEGADIWDAVDRGPGNLAASAAAVAPNPVLVMPDLRVNFNRERAGGFTAFYRRRLDEVAPDAAFPVAVLQYAGGLGRRDGLLPQPEPLEWYTAANRAVRLRLDGADGYPLAVTAIAPTLYLPVWVTRPAAEVTTQTDPAEVELSGDATLFGFGAERLGEMNPTMVRRTIDTNIDQLMACDPGGTEPVPVDIQLMVEPGGTTVMVLIAAEPWTVGQCLIDTFADLLFPLATGSPVAVRFPIVYQAR